MRLVFVQDARNRRKYSGTSPLVLYCNVPNDEINSSSVVGNGSGGGVKTWWIVALHERRAWIGWLMDGSASDYEQLVVVAPTAFHYNADHRTASRPWRIEADKATVNGDLCSSNAELNKRRRGSPRPQDRRRTHIPSVYYCRGMLKLYKPIGLYIIADFTLAS